VTIKVLPAKGGWYFVVKSRNGRTLCHSEVYREKRKAIKTARLFGLPIK